MRCKNSKGVIHDSKFIANQLIHASDSLVMIIIRSPEPLLLLFLHLFIGSYILACLFPCDVNVRILQGEKKKRKQEIVKWLFRFRLIIKFGISLEFHGIDNASIEEKAESFSHQRFGETWFIDSPSFATFASRLSSILFARLNSSHDFYISLSCSL